MPDAPKAGSGRFQLPEAAWLCLKLDHGPLRELGGAGSRKDWLSIVGCK